ncbi:Kinesin-like protein kip2 [Puccinia graminis f. sp. tritici]|uniref:Kinesin-like protein kip2 n=1 Tax=Puccinia graminis f. sp. tritici TaxID=56615 RepID=A0A5B0QHS9_PUCGR|nr:Kinesin-like protein kip2 [Puccinia graminis f. sp. tritici]
MSTTSSYEPIDPRDFERRPSTPINSRASPDKKPICSGLFISSNSSSAISTTTTIITPTKNTSQTTNSSSKFTPTRKQPLTNNNSNNNNSSSGNSVEINQIRRPRPQSAIIQPSASFNSLNLTPTTPTRIRTITSSSASLTRPDPNLRSPQFIPHQTTSIVPPPSSLNSPLRASLTAEAIPRKKSILPGAPNPLHHNRLRSLKSSSSPFTSPLSSSHLNQSPAHIQSPSLLKKSQSHFNLSQSPAHLNRSPTLFQAPIVNQSLVYDTPIEEPPIGKAQLENVLVAIRLKGVVDPQLDSPKIYWSISPDGTQIGEVTPQTSCGLNQSSNSTSSWSFDSVFGQNATNEDVYRRSGARDLILSAMAGYDATIFAYGQTASGKTHTLTGSAQQPGIIPLSVQEIFTFIRSHPEREFLLRVSYLEVYNEQIHDLLVPTTQSTSPPVKIRQQTNGMFFADPVREEVVTNVGQVATLISRGERQRHVAGTDWNARSSRSHTIFGIVIESRLYGVEGGVRRSKVCLIDLAGNERASSEVERRSEGSFINKSLLTLEKVISGLAEPSGQTKKRNQHIPYRDSKLTQILQPSLSGKSRVCVICTMNWTFQSIEDSRSTLRFASRVKKIQTSAGVNEILSDNALMIRYRQQIVDLQTQLRDAVNKANQTNENIDHYQQVPHKPVTVGDESQIEKAEEERLKIKKQLKELQSIILNADTLDQVEGLSKEARPVSPVKKHSNQAWISGSDSESEDSDERENGTQPAAGEKGRREKMLEERIELQAYEIACLRLELIGLKFKTKRNKSVHETTKQTEANNSVNAKDSEANGEVQDHEIEEAVKRVAESRESLEDRLAEQALEIKNRKKFTQEVLNLLDASRAKSKKLELFVLKEMQKATRRLSTIERNAYSKNNRNQSERDGGKKISGRRRSSSINSNPYGPLLSNPSSLGQSVTYHQNPNQHQDQLMAKLQSNLDLHSSVIKDSGGNFRTTVENRHPVESDSQVEPNSYDDETETDDQEISTLLSIVNESPELECIRMSFGDTGHDRNHSASSNEPHRLHR